MTTLCVVKNCNASCGDRLLISPVIDPSMSTWCLITGRSLLLVK